MSEYDYANRAEFILAGFKFEINADGSCRLTSSIPMKDGNPDWQGFTSLEQMVIWLAAGASEIQHAGLVTDLYIKGATRRRQA